MKVPKERIIYNNYDLWEKYSDECLTEMAHECGWIDDDEEPTNDQLIAWRYEEDSIDWDAEKEMLDNFFENVNYIGFFGEIGRWNGVYRGGKIDTDFWKLFDDAITDCDYIKIYDENGHLYLTCSHHDGTCHFEIKEITDEGYEYYDRWSYNWNDNRKESQVMDQIYKRYSRLPNYANKVFGCKKREYEPVTKEVLVTKLNNKAKSFYS